MADATPDLTPAGALPRAGVQTVERHHAEVSGGRLRAAVFGAMDGLVSNIALIAGVGGAGMAARTVVLTGTAGLVAGAISMALGEYTSVRAQGEQVAAEVAKERRELERNPEVEVAELAQVWIDRGLSADLARRVSQEVHANTEAALRIHAWEELGVDPDVQPSPWVAATSSFVCFAIGAVIPLLPYLFGATVLWPALIAGGAGLFLTGAVVARFTLRPWWLSALRQLLLGSAAAGATYLIGMLIGGGKPI